MRSTNLEILEESILFSREIPSTTFCISKPTKRLIRIWIFVAARSSYWEPSAWHCYSHISYDVCDSYFPLMGSSLLVCILVSFGGLNPWVCAQSKGFNPSLVFIPCSCSSHCNYFCLSRYHIIKNCDYRFAYHLSCGKSDWNIYNNNLKISVYDFLEIVKYWIAFLLHAYFL